jgi:hypothetical protein
MSTTVWRSPVDNRATAHVVPSPSIDLQRCVVPPQPPRRPDLPTPPDSARGRAVCGDGWLDLPAPPRLLLEGKPFAVMGFSDQRFHGSPSCLTIASNIQGVIAISTAKRCIDCFVALLGFGVGIFFLQLPCGD